MDLLSIIEKINGFSSVKGYVIVDNESNIVHTSLDAEDAITLAAIVIKMIGEGKEVMNEYRDDELEYMRIRSKKRDIQIVPGTIYSFAVIRDPDVNSN